MKNDFDLFDKENHLTPNFKPAEFDSLHSWDLGWALLEPINLGSDYESEISLSKRLSGGQKALYFFWYLDAEVTNGGFIQFYWNDKRKYLPAIKAGLELIKDHDMLNLVERADDLFLKNKIRFDNGATGEDFSKLYDDIPKFEDLDEEYYKLHEITMDRIETYARNRPSEFVAF